MLSLIGRNARLANIPSRMTLPTLALCLTCVLLNTARGFFN